MIFIIRQKSVLLSNLTNNYVSGNVCDKTQTEHKYQEIVIKGHFIGEKRFYH